MAVWSTDVVMDTDLALVSRLQNVKSLYSWHRMPGKTYLT